MRRGHVRAAPSLVSRTHQWKVARKLLDAKTFVNSSLHASYLENSTLQFYLFEAAVEAFVEHEVDGGSFCKV